MRVQTVTGWDIGGVNIKRADVAGSRVTSTLSCPFAIQRTPSALVGQLRAMCSQQSPVSDTHAVTMTAELSQLFRTKREGVAFVLDAFDEAFPNARVRVYTVDGRFISTAEARDVPLRAAASNWHATASIVARSWRDATLVDIGSTTTDIIPIRNGEVVARGLTDLDRLASRELLYLGAVRTPVEAVVQEVPIGDGTAGVSAESFALTGDVHVWQRDLSVGDYDADTTPDGRPVALEFVRERLARIVCADREMLDDPAIDVIARHVAQAQVARTARAMSHVGGDARAPVVAAGIGAFIVHRAAALVGIPVVDLASVLGAEAARIAPAAAVALLLAADPAP